ncbi:hypothetical protein B0H14DRAFT_3447978 [Mycena olivaceomarginata]|nr:hypothetical protein B0H14DRAFT_3447978 [Mycena olivaceomarginata]
MASPYPGILLCVPQYMPDLGHEDRYKHPGPFHAVVCKEWRDVVTSKCVFLLFGVVLELPTVVQGIPRPDDGAISHAYTWQATSWWTFDRKWTLDCREYHEHEGESPTGPATPDSTEPSSPSTPTESTTSRAPSPAAPPSPSPRCDGEHNKVRAAEKLSKQQLAHLANFRPGPGPISAACLREQFARVLGPQAVVLGKMPTVGPQKRETTLLAHEVANVLRAGGKVTLTANGPKIVMPQGSREAEQGRNNLSTQRRKAVEGFVEWTQENRDQGPTAVMYAVSGNQCIFQNRDHAMAVLKRSPGAELLFTSDEDELFEFLAKDLEGKLQPRSPTALHTARLRMPKEPTLSAHTARNPTKPVQQPRQRQVSQATKATRALAVEQRAENDLALTAKFNEIFIQREEDIKTLAKEYKKTETYIRQVLENSTHYTGKRALSLKNAITHRLSQEARDKGETYNTRDEQINLSGEQYRAYRDSLTEEEKKSLLDDLAESKNTKEHGVRATNKAVALDAMQTTSQIGRVIIALHSRTAVRGFAMFTRGHPDDSAMPSFVESDEASKFFEDTFDCSVWDVVRKFELWSCNRDKMNNRNDIDAVRKYITELVEGALRKITGDKTVTMSWTNYKIDIVHTLGVEMAGWPSSVVMVRPSKMAADVARRILDKLRSGAIHWVALTRSQRAEVAEEVEALRESGAVKQQKQRSDKNKPHSKKSDKRSNPNASEDDSEEEPMDTTPLSTPRAPTAPASAPRAPTTPVSAPRVPTAPTSTPRVPTAPHIHSPCAHRPRVRSPPFQHPRICSPPIQRPRVDVQRPRSQTSQAATLAALGSTPPATSLSNGTTAFTGTPPAPSATPAAFSLTSPASSLSTSAVSLPTSAALSAGTMPFGSLADDHFDFDFAGMDFGLMPMALFPSSTSTPQLGLSADELTNDGAIVRINASNREDLDFANAVFTFDGGFNGGNGGAGDPSPLFAYNSMGGAPSAHASGETAGYVGATDNLFRGVAHIPPNCFRPGAVHVGLLCGHQQHEPRDDKKEEG